eukprot:Nitzschia sp. Nitz4//scaffold45_size130396//4102//6956//NITZ4_003426-RA/size130396-processed-gene-0.170-mRNA-1//1//CDS//3329552329//6163//frame0
MKRALAERAKQSGLPNGVGHAVPSDPTLPQSSLVEPPAPAPAPTAPPTTSAPSAPPSKPPSTSPRPKKRLRESIVKLQEEDEEDANASAFYLRHQNRALSSELRHLHNQLHRLERERSFRRTQCTQAANALHTLQATWTRIEQALQKHALLPQVNGANSSTSAGPDVDLSAAHQSPPLSTGSGTSVEVLSSLLNALTALGEIPSPSCTYASSDAPPALPSASDATSTATNDVAANDDDQDQMMDTDQVQSSQMQSQELCDLSKVSQAISERAYVLQNWIFSLLPLLPSDPSVPKEVQETATTQLHRQLDELRAQQETSQAQIQELGRTRDELAESDRRVRRGLYRLASKRMQLDQVLKAIVASDEDKDAIAAFMDQEQEAISAAHESAPTQEEAPGGSGVSSALLDQWKQKYSDVEQLSTAREEQINQLLMERDEQTKRINSLIATANASSTTPTEENMVSEIYTELNTKLATAERTVAEMRERERLLKEEWSQALANSKMAHETIEELQAKHSKRWAEFGDEDNATSTEEGGVSASAQAEEIIKLQHKLTQALENVRQAEHTRQTLQEAVVMNESLNAKLDEVKAKYSALQLSRANSSAHHSSSAATPPPPSMEGITTPKAKSSASAATPSSEKSDRSEKPEKSSSDKHHREYRRLQKQLAAATASKESAKAKLERTEKERDMLNAANARLLKQAVEKDEMNAKSLSTILHLKQLTDQVTKEKENLEAQVKSAQQVALSARLASNARERLSEEMEKERKSMEARVEEWESKCQEINLEKDQIEGRISQEQAKISGLKQDLESVKARCDELASESASLRQEKRTALESMATAQKKAADAVKQTERLAKASGNAVVGGFTAEQLHTQVKHLKSRVNCPVCNARDKNCILLRCRHMFCKNCVDENIKNRSRKCPACGIRFDTKDVADIWL